MVDTASSLIDEATRQIMLRYLNSTQHTYSEAVAMLQLLFNVKNDPNFQELAETVANQIIQEFGR